MRSANHPVFARRPDFISRGRKNELINNRRIRTLSALILLVVIVSVFSGCSKAQPVPPPATSTTFPITVSDDTGRSLTIDKKPEKIVSLAPSNTEILYALGLGGKVVGNTEYCDYPEEAKDVEKVGGFSDPNIEKIVSLEPDLVLGATMHEKHVADMEKLGLKVVLINATNIDGVMKDVELVGQITGQTQEAETVVSDMQEKVSGVQTALKDLADDKKVKVFYLMWDDPITTVGSNTLISDVLITAGGVNVAADAEQDYPNYSLEVLVTKNPDAIVYTKMGSGTGLNPDTIKSKSGWEAISAVKNDRIYSIDDNLMSRPGPRIVDGLIETAKVLYPDRFTK